MLFIIDGARGGSSALQARRVTALTGVLENNGSSGARLQLPSSGVAGHTMGAMHAARTRTVSRVLVSPRPGGRGTTAGGQRKSPCFVLLLPRLGDNSTVPGSTGFRLRRYKPNKIANSEAIQAA